MNRKPELRQGCRLLCMCLAKMTSWKLKSPRVNMYAMEERNQPYGASTVMFLDTFLCKAISSYEFENFWANSCVYTWGASGQDFSMEKYHISVSVFLSLWYKGTPNLASSWSLTWEDTQVLVVSIGTNWVESLHVFRPLNLTNVRRLYIKVYNGCISLLSLCKWALLIRNPEFSYGEKKLHEYLLEVLLHALVHGEYLNNPKYLSLTL